MKNIILLFALISTASINAQQVIQLYQGTIPESIPAANKEQSVKEGSAHLKNVSQPTLTIYKPAIQSAVRSAVIVCPGGGYGMLAMDHEGTDVAKALNAMGVTAFVLKYRLPDDAIMKDKANGPLQDVQRAFQLVRERAAEWNLDTTKIGVMGFSAGGHLAATASTQYKRSVIINPQQTSLRPDFSILIYPVISFSDELTHMGSRNNLIGKTPETAMVKLYSNELQVTKDTPPAFLVHSADDGAVPVGNSIVYYEALIKNGVLSEMHLYPKGGHGYGMMNKTTADKWMDSLKNWLIAGKFL